MGLGGNNPEHTQHKQCHGLLSASGPPSPQSSISPRSTSPGRNERSRDGFGLNMEETRTDPPNH